MNDLHLVLQSKRVGPKPGKLVYYFDIGYNKAGEPLFGEPKAKKPLCSSQFFAHKSEMKQALVDMVRQLAADDFAMHDESEEAPPRKSHVVGTVQINGKNKVWQVVVKHDFVLQVKTEHCPCKKNDDVAVYDNGRVTLGGEEFEVVKKIDSGGAFDVYVVKPKK
jgi:hypothetical protein